MFDPSNSLLAAELQQVVIVYPARLAEPEEDELVPALLRAELFDEIAKKYVASNPLFKEIIQSQLAFAKRATQWEQDYITPRRMAFDHYFGPNAKSPI